MTFAKRSIFILALFPFLLHAQVDKTKFEPLSMIALLANPDRYNGHWVCLEGYLHELPGDRALYVSKEDADHELSMNAVWIEHQHLDQQRVVELSREWHARYVQIEGRFFATPRKFASGIGGIKRPYGGTLKMIESMSSAGRRFDGAMDLILRERNLKGPPRPPIPDSLLHGPCNLDQAHALLRFELPDSAIGKIMATPQNELSNYHMGLGRWMRNNWGLWKGGCLADYIFDSLRVFHPDDMSGVILSSFWSRLHGQPFNVQEYLLTLESFYVPNMEPEKCICSLDSSGITFTRLVTRRGPGGEKEVLIWGTCFDHHHGWLYSKETGWKRSDPYPLVPWYPANLTF